MAYIYFSISLFFSEFLRILLNSLLFNWFQEFEKYIILWINFYQPALHTLVQKNTFGIHIFNIFFFSFFCSWDRCKNYCNICRLNSYFLLYFFKFLSSFLAPWQSLTFCATWHSLTFFFLIFWLPVSSSLVRFWIICAAVEDTPYFLIASLNFSPASKRLSF